MKARAYLIIAAVLLISGFASWMSALKGTAGFSGALPVSAAHIDVCAQITGWPAVLGFLCLLLSVLFYIAGLVKAVDSPPTRN